MLRRLRMLPALAALLGAACSSTIENRDPTGEVFPDVAGESLAGKDHRLPADLAGRKAILLVGYVQKTQFDLDRWILGLVQAEVSAPIYEVPTVKGLLAGLASGMIDEGMRSGIPSEDWKAVITVYGDAGRITSFTGTENPRNTRVLLLDEKGEVLWFHDRGYSAGKLVELISKLDG